MATGKPYKPSWVDRLMAWLQDLPWPVWLSLAMIYIISVLAYHAAIWIDGLQPFGSLSGYLIYAGLWSVIGLGFLYIIYRSAERAIDKFSVLVPAKKKELEELRYQITTIPARFAFWSAMVMAAVIGFAAYSDPAFLYKGIHGPMAYAIFLVVTIFSYSFAPILIYQGFRQLRGVNKAYELVREINIFHLQPLYAFSGLTMASSLLWILVLNLSIYGDFVLKPSSSLADLAINIAVNTPLIVLAFITFLLPLWGIHKRIQQKKEEVREENGLEIHRVHQNLLSHLRKNDYKTGGDAERVLTSLYKMREQIEKVPTWPWNPGSLRNFLSAVFLPLALWLVQQFLRGLLSL